MTKVAKPPLKWRPYQIYLVALVLSITILNYLDRFILGAIQEPIKRELGLTDFQLGLLGGPAFGLLYALAGLPIARLAERINRAGLLAVCLAFWSAMTALCGAAHSFLQLVLARLGVGAGEGGCIPITHSLLADNFNARQRGIALSAVSAASPIAAILTPLIGGIVAQHFGWRVAFMTVGLPGLALAMVTWLTVREPREAIQGKARDVTHSRFLTDIGWLARNRAFLLLFLAAAFIGIGNNGILVFEMSFLIRSFNLSLVEAGSIKSITGVAGLIGTFIGGLAADRFADNRGRSYVLVPAVGGALAFAMYFIGYNQSTWAIALPFLLIATLAYNLKNGPIFAAVQNIVPAHMRATGAAVHMIAATVAGSLLGPPLAGAVSDLLAQRAFGDALGSFAAQCPGGHALPDAAPAIGAACKLALAQGLRGALITVSFCFAISSVLLYFSSRTIRMGVPDEQ